MNKQDLIMWIIMVGVIIAIILVGVIVMNKVGTIEEYCLEHPNSTLYTSDGKEDKCINVLNDIYFNNELDIK